MTNCPSPPVIAQLVVLALAIIYVVFAIVGKPSWWVSILVLARSSWPAL